MSSRTQCVLPHTAAASIRCNFAWQPACRVCSCSLSPGSLPRIRRSTLSREHWTLTSVTARVQPCPSRTELLSFTTAAYQRPCHQACRCVSPQHGSPTPRWMLDDYGILEGAVGRMRWPPATVVYYGYANVGDVSRFSFHTMTFRHVYGIWAATLHCSLSLALAPLVRAHAIQTLRLGPSTPSRSLDRSFNGRIRSAMTPLRP